MNQYEKTIKLPEKYDFKDLSFTYQNLILEGTLVSPKMTYDKVIIIAPGSGKDTRNNHYILTEKLLEKGIAVFRYDDRGVGESGGKYKKNRNINIQDLEAAYNHLKNIKSLSDKRIGILGHSMGGGLQLLPFKNVKM